MIEERVRPDWIPQGAWDAFGVAGFATTCGVGMAALPDAVRWTVEHDLRWLGFVVLCGGVVFALTICWITLVLLYRLVVVHVDGHDT